MIRKESNVHIHLGFSILVIAAGFVFNISRMEWIAVLLCIGGVLTAEGLNTSIERLADLYSLDKNKDIRIIKDVSAGAVLIMAIIAAVVGVIVFLPYLNEFIQH